MEALRQARVGERPADLGLTLREVSPPFEMERHDGRLRPRLGEMHRIEGREGQGRRSRGGHFSRPKAFGPGPRSFESAVGEA